MLSILERFIDPCFEHLGAHLHLLILALEAGTLRLHLAYVIADSTLFDASDSFEWSTFIGLATGPITTGRGSSRTKFEVSSGCKIVATLTVHLLAHLLKDDRGVKEAFEIVCLANSRELEATIAAQY